MPSPENFQQLALRFTDPVQHDCEIIRGIMLADETIADRSRLTGVSRDTVGEKARRFLEEGVLGLVDRHTTSEQGGHQIPDVVSGYILYLKQRYPAVHYREISRIIERKYGYKSRRRTIRHFLERHPIPVQPPLSQLTFLQFEDAYQARFTVVRVYYEGWHQQSIANCLQLSHKHVWHILTVFKEDGFAGLEDQRTRPATHPENQLTLPILADLLDVQKEHPRAGRFRVRGVVAQRKGQAPSEATVGRGMAINRQHHGAPPAWNTDRQEDDPAADEVKYLPYRPTHRHRYWFIDIRYLVRIGEDQHWVYSLHIIEGYFRKILAGMATEYQDVGAILQLVAAALAEYGRPAGVVSDNGSAFTSDAYQGFLETLGIEACHVEKGKPWQNLIEAQFKVELRLADAAFERAETLEKIQERHAAFVELFNTTPHWAHRQRDDGLRTPVEVLQWVRGAMVEPDVVQRALRQLQVERVVTLRGCVSVQRFYLYAERGLSRKRVSIWLHGGRLQVAYGDSLLAQYRYRYDRSAKRLREVTAPQLFQTAHVSLQLELWELDDEQWRKIACLPYERHELRGVSDVLQLALVDTGPAEQRWISSSV